MQPGIKYILISNLFSLLVEVSVKALTDIPFYFIAFYRSIIVTFICLGYLFLKKIPVLGNERRLLLTRGITGTIALVLYFMTLQNLPLALAVTLQYLSPLFAVFFLSLLSKSIPKNLEMISLFLSFLGVILLNELDLSESWVYTALGLLSAVFSGLAYTNISRLNKTDNTVVIMLYFSATTLIAVGPYCAFRWQENFSSQNYVILFLVGISSYVTQYYVTKAYQTASATLIAPIYYLNLVFASLIGYLAWDEVITKTMLIGMLLIISGNLLINIKKQELSTFSN